MNVHVVKVAVGPSENGLTKVRLDGAERESHHSSGWEAHSAAICIALETMSRKVARGEVPSTDGFTVRVELVRVTK